MTSDLTFGLHLIPCHHSALESAAILGKIVIYLLFFSQDGVWIKGLYLEGAGWEKKASCLVEANPMQLVCPMPTIHFKPVESKRRSAKGKIFYTTAYLTIHHLHCKL